MRNGNDFREREEKLDVTDPLEFNVWYRSPLWTDDHMLGETKELANEAVAWCGRALGHAQHLEDTGVKASLGGLWKSSRTTGKCATCRRRQEEYDESFHPTVY